jgi:four helix bundle protein
MSKINTFEDIQAWQESRLLAQQTYELCKKGGLSKDFGLKDQIRRSAISISSSIAEGFGRGPNQEFIRFLRIAQGSSYEFRSQLYTLSDAGYIDSTTFDSMHSQAIKVPKLIGGFLRYLESLK